MKIITVIGARPQFIKAAVVSRELAKCNNIDEIIVHTGQYYDSNMSDVFFNELDIPKPVINLGIGGGSHGHNTGRMIEALEQVMVELKPDCVLVYGDTDSTLAGSVSAVKLHIPVAHIEAGLRSFNRCMPEEINRVLTDHASSLLFTPSLSAVEHLAAEGIAGDSVRHVGDVMYDAALYYRERAKALSCVIEKLELTEKSYTLATVHRAENTDSYSCLDAILSGFAEFGQAIVLPLHPRTQRRIDSYGLVFPDNVKLIEPVGYLDMLSLEVNANLIVTDSGGVQKEAFFHRVPCVTLRAETEWTELIEANWNRLVIPIDQEEVSVAMSEAIGTVGEDIQPYGNGNASELIADRLNRNIML